MAYVDNSWGAQTTRLANETSVEVTARMTRSNNTVRQVACTLLCAPVCCLCSASRLVGYYTGWCDPGAGFQALIHCLLGLLQVLLAQEDPMKVLARMVVLKKLSIHVLYQ